MKAILHEACATLEKFPSISEFEKIAVKLNISPDSGWKYFDVDDCFTCGGPGWHYVTRTDGGEAVVACDDCRAGKNLQLAPKGVIKHTQRQAPNTEYLGPARGRTREETHIEIIRRFGSLTEVANAIANRNLSTTDISRALVKHIANSKRAPRNDDNPNFDKKLEF